MKKSVVIVLFVSIMLVTSISFASAGFFNDLLDLFKPKPKISEPLYSPPTAGLVAHYTFDSNNFQDSSGVHNGICESSGTCPTFTSSGFSGSSAVFDGINDYFITDDLTTDFQPSKSFTISVWFNSEREAIITAETWTFPLVLGGGKLGLQTMEIGPPGATSSETALIAVFGPDATTAAIVGLGKKKATFNEWHNAIIRYDESTQKLDGYLDGVKSSSAFGDRAAPWDLGVGLSYVFGRTLNGPSPPFKGEMDEILVYNRVLSDSEAQGLYLDFTVVCSNGVIESGEACDGSALGGNDCTTIGQGFTGGTLGCTAACTFDTSQCTLPPFCRDGNLDPGEECDAPDLGGNDCTTIGQGFTGGTLGCTALCAFDTSSCIGPICGNGVLESGETCDDGNTDGNDGCSNICQVESGWDCTGGVTEPSVCSAVACTPGDLSGCNGGNVINSFSCDGKDLLNVTSTPTCTNNNCDSTQDSFIEETCSFQCANGACQPECSPSVPCNTGEICSPQGTCTQILCNNNNNNNDCNTGEICFEGSCILGSTCIDSDANSLGNLGVNLSVASNVSYANGTLIGEDSCLGNDITEWFCESDIGKSITQTCVEGCSNGACVGEVISQVCTDSDDGIDYTEKGNVEITFGNEVIGSFNDTCTSDNRLKEYFCEDNVKKLKTHFCSLGCSDGECIIDTSGVPGGGGSCIDGEERCGAGNNFYYLCLNGEWLDAQFITGKCSYGEEDIPSTTFECNADSDCEGDEVCGIDNTCQLAKNDSESSIGATLFVITVILLILISFIIGFMIYKKVKKQNRKDNARPKYLVHRPRPPHHPLVRPSGNYQRRRPI